MASLTPKIESEVSAFVADIKAAAEGNPSRDVYVKRIRRRGVSVVKSLLAEYEYNTAKDVLKFYRNAVRDEFGVSGRTPTEAANEPLLRYLVLPADVSRRIKNRYLAAKTKARSGQIDVNARKFKAAALEALQRDNYSFVTVGLCALTGRRPAEVLLYGSFSPGSSKSTVVFSGQSKTRGAEGTKQEPYEIPVLADAETILAAFARLKTLRDFSALSYEQLHNLTGSTLTEATRKVFADSIDVPGGATVKTKDLRACYAAICYRAFCATQKRKKGARGCSVIEFYSRILGHSLISGGEESGAARVDQMTAAAYDYVRVV